MLASIFYLMQSFSLIKNIHNMVIRSTNSSYVSFFHIQPFEYETLFKGNKAYTA